MVVTCHGSCQNGPALKGWRRRRRQRGITPPRLPPELYEPWSRMERSPAGSPACKPGPDEMHPMPAGSLSCSSAIFV